MIMIRPGWVTASAIYNWILGVLTLLSGIAVITIASTAFDTWSGSFLDQFLPSVGNGLILSIVFGLLIFLFGLLRCACGYGLMGMMPRFRMPAFGAHVLAALVTLLTIFLMIRQGLVATSLLPIVFLSAEIALAVGLMLQSTREAFETGGGGSADPTQFAFPANNQPNYQHFTPAPGGYPPLPDQIGVNILPNQSTPGILPHVQSPQQVTGIAAGGTTPLSMSPAAASISAGGSGGALQAVPVRGSYNASGSGFGTPGAGSGDDRKELSNPEPGSLAWLVERNGLRPGNTHQLRAQVTLGRSQRCEVVLDESKVSSEHARIKLEQGHYVLYDLASTNHTYVNNQEIQRHVLRDGDEIRLGPNVRLSFMRVDK